MKACARSLVLVSVACVISLGCGRLGYDGFGGSPPDEGDPDAGDISGPPVEGLIAYWPMDSVTSNGTTDVVGNNTATCTTDCPATTAGMFDSAVTFDGSSSCLRVPSLDDWDVPAFTISAWISASSMSGPVVVHESSSGCPSPSMEIGNSSLGLIQLNTTGNHNEAWTASAVVVSQAWHQIAVRWNGVSQEVYVDGQCVCMAAPQDMPDNNVAEFTIGCYPGAGSLFSGAIDEVLVYDRALTETEMIDLAGDNGQTPVSCPAVCASVPL